MTQPSCPQVYDTHFWLTPVSTWREHHVMSAWVTLVVFYVDFQKYKNFFQFAFIICWILSVLYATLIWRQRHLVTGFTFVNFQQMYFLLPKLENLHYWGNCPTYMYHDELKKRNALYLENKLKNASQFLFIIYSQIIHWKTRMLDNLHNWTFYALLPLS